MSEGETASVAIGLGSRLAAAREAAGLSLPEAAERLHLDAATLAALEREHYQTLGAAVYVRGHLRRYAELLGLPVAEIEAAYGRTSGAVSGMPDLRRVATPLEAAGTPSWSMRPGPAAAVAVLLAVAALVWWAMRMPHSSRGAAPGSAAPAANDSTVSAPPAEPETRPAPVPAALPPAPPPAPPAQSAPAGSGVPPAVGLTVPHGATAPGAAPAPGSVRLALQFRENSWVEIYDANGARLLYELATAGSERTLHGGAPLRILLGNPGGVNLAVDGRPVTFGEPVRGDSPLRLSLDGSGRVLEVRAAVTAGAATGPAGNRP
jgi:cytoskeleton protein RodZ